MSTATPFMTAEDLLRLPDDGFRYELVRGELRKMPPAGYQHGKIAVRLTTPLDQHASAHRLGVVCAAETGFRLGSSPDTVRAPDVAFIRRERVEAVGDVKGYWPGAPDLVAEVVSPGDRYTEVQDKVLDWLSAGTRMVLVVEPATRVITVYRSLTDITVLGEADVLNGGDVVPGWRLPVREVFASQG